MTAADRLIDDIMAASRIPFHRCRLEVRRELQAHVDDFITEGRRNGHTEQEIECLLLEQFGDPRQVAAHFSHVYRRERAALHLGAFLLSTLAVSIVIAVAALSIRAGILIGLGAPAASVLASRHTTTAALNVLTSAAACLGFLSLERFFRRPWLVLAAIAAALASLFAASGLPFLYILFGFANGTLLLAIHRTVRRPALRLAATLASFAALAAVFFHPSSSALTLTAASWLVMGAAYHVMTHLATRVDRILLRDV